MARSASHCRWTSGVLLSGNGPPICDYAVRCEADQVLPELLSRLDQGRSAEDLPGISCIRDGTIRHNPEPDPPEVPRTIPDVSLIEGFEEATKGWGKLRIINTLQTTRGCRFRCKFCPTLKLFQGRYRSRPVDAVIEDIKERKKYGRLFFVVDNEFFSNKETTRTLLERLIEEDLGVWFCVFARHEIGRDPEMLALAKRAGVNVMIVGVESLRNGSLGTYNKEQTTDDVMQSLEAMRSHGIHVLSTFVLGCDEDTPSVVPELIQFIKSSGLSLNLFIMHDIDDDDGKKLLIPKERRFRTYWERGRPGDVSYWDYFTGNFVTYFPLNMKPSTLQMALIRINEEVYTHRTILSKLRSESLTKRVFEVGFGYGIKEMNENVKKIVTSSYLHFLHQIERDLYDDQEHLLESRLETLDRLPLPPPLVEGLNSRFYQGVKTVVLLPTVTRLRLRVLVRETAKAYGLR